MDTIKELEYLRKADEELGGQLITINLLRLGFVVVVTFLFVRALVNAKTGDIAILQQQIADRVQQLKARPEPLDPIGLLLGSPTWEDQRGLSVADEQLTADTAKLRKQYDAVYDFSLSALGTSLKMDLRALILSLPFWLVPLHVYLITLRTKRQVLHAIAQGALAGVSPDAHLLDRLAFGGGPDTPSPFRSFPQILVEWTSRFALAVLGIVTLIFFLPFLFTGANTSYYVYPFMFGAIAVAIYGHAVAMAIRSQLLAGVRANAGENAYALRAERLWRWIEMRGKSMLAGCKPRRWVGTGGALLLLTLFLITGERSCDGHHGYEIVTGKAELAGAGLTAEFGNQWLDSLVQKIEIGVSRSVYTGAMLLALVSVWIAVRGAAPQFPPTRRLVIAASISLCCFMGTYLIKASFLPSTFLWMPPWIASTFLWCRYAFFSRRSRFPWNSIRKALAIAYFPIALADLFVLVSAYSTWIAYPGLLVFFLSTYILAFGQVAWATQDHFKKATE